MHTYIYIYAEDDGTNPNRSTHIPFYLLQLTHGGICLLTNFNVFASPIPVLKFHALPWLLALPW